MSLLHQPSQQVNLIGTQGSHDCELESETNSKKDEILRNDEQQVVQGNGNMHHAGQGDDEELAEGEDQHRAGGGVGDEKDQSY